MTYHGCFGEGARGSIHWSRETVGKVVRCLPCGEIIWKIKPRRKKGGRQVGKVSNVMMCKRT